MRIRKRFPATEGAPVSLSDLQIINRSLLLQQYQQPQQTNANHQHHQPKHNNVHSLPSDEITAIPRQDLSRSVQSSSSIAVNDMETKPKEKVEGAEEVSHEIGKKAEKEKEEEETSNDIRKRSIFREEMESFNNQPPLSSTSYSQGDNKLVPLKKRKGNFQRNSNKETTKSKMKSNTNKKCAFQNSDDLGAKMEKKSNMNDGKVKKGSVIMEGSRCSRVNGRGWRCCQPTLVGYSLCEHHLGKGRLRSMTSVRNHNVTSSSSSSNSGAPPLPPKVEESAERLPCLRKEDRDENKSSSTLLDEMMNDDDDDDDEKKMASTRKSIMKLGTIRARSMSSLLGQKNS